MSLTREQLEAELIARAGDWMVKAGMDGTTVDGTNADLDGPIAWGLRQAGTTLADPLAPTSGEIASVTDSDKVFDLAELRLLRNVYQNYTKVDVSSPAGAAKLDQLRQALRDAIRAKMLEIADTYSIGGYTTFSVQTRRADGYAAYEAEWYE